MFVTLGLIVAVGAGVLCVGALGVRGQVPWCADLFSEESQETCSGFHVGLSRAAQIQNEAFIDLSPSSLIRLLIVLGG